VSNAEARLPEDFLSNPDEVITHALHRLEAHNYEKCQETKAVDMPTTATAPEHLGPETHSLQTTAWIPEERCGKFIWQSPDSGFWYSQEMALMLVERQDNDPGRG
jgi:hypothetical protein